MDGKGVRATLARNIKEFRGRRNWSQADLAEKAGLSIVYLSDIERGNKWPYLDTMVKLANALELDIYQLLMPKNIPPPTVAAILDKYNEEVAAILTKNFKTTEKNLLRSLEALKNQYRN